MQELKYSTAGPFSYYTKDFLSSTLEFTTILAILYHVILIVCLPKYRTMKHKISVMALLKAILSMLQLTEPLGSRCT